LTFDPKPGAPSRLPWFVPGASGVLESKPQGQFALRVLAGTL
jgi:hypothetical protein